MTALRGLLICLIILPVLVYSNHFSQETFATANTEDLDSETARTQDLDSETARTQDLDSEGNSGDNENNNDLGQQVTANLGGSEDEDEDEDTGGLADEDTAGSEEIGGLPGPVVDDTLNSDTRGLAGAVDGSVPRDLDDDDDRFRHNAEDIAMELISLPPEEIREYPITDLSDNDIILVFGFLNPGNLTKVLLNIPQEDLADIRDRLTPVTFTESLSRISEVDRSQVGNRLVFATTVN